MSTIINLFYSLSSGGHVFLSTAIIPFVFHPCIRGLAVAPTSQTLSSSVSVGILHTPGYPPYPLQSNNPWESPAPPGHKSHCTTEFLVYCKDNIITQSIHWSQHTGKQIERWMKKHMTYVTKDDLDFQGHGGLPEPEPRLILRKSEPRQTVEWRDTGRRESLYLDMTRAQTRPETRDDTGLIVLFKHDHFSTSFHLYKVGS